MPALHNFSPAAADARARWQKYLSLPEFYPRDEDFGELLQVVFVGLQKLCETNSRVLLLTCAGTGALECAIAALPQEKRIIVIRNGYFGQRLLEIACLHHPQTFAFDLPFGESFHTRHEAALVRLLEEKGADVIIGVHLETSSTVLNDAALMGRIGREHQALTIMDGVSALGAVHCPLREWGINCYVASVYKALMCPTGLSLIFADDEFLSGVARRWSYYYDLRRLSEASGAGRYLWSPSVLSLQCLRGTIAEILAAGQSTYFHNLEMKAQQFRSELAHTGFEIFGDPRYLSPCFTAIRLKSHNAGDWQAKLKKEWGIVIGTGMGDSSADYLRIGHYPHKSLEELAHLAAALASMYRNG